MKKLIALLATAVMIAAGAGVASARECPLLIKQLKDASAKETDAKKKAEADKLIAQAQKQHEEGKHADSVKTADDAAKVLGVQLQHKQ
jgi:hypothetical protein